MYKKILIISLFALFVVSGCKKDSQLDEDCEKIEDYLSENGDKDFLFYRDNSMFRHRSENDSDFEQTMPAIEKYNNTYCRMIKEGDGEQFVAGDSIAILYRTALLSNPDKAIDSCLVKAFEAFTETTVSGSGSLLAGVQYGLTTMKVGGKSVFYIPSSLAYGSESIGGETYANLVFYCELLAIIHKK